MKSILILVAMLCAMCMVQSAVAQDVRGQQQLIEGQKYVVAFPKVWAAPSEKPMNPSMMVFVSSRTKANISIKTPAGINTAPPINRDYTLEPNKILQIPISTAYMNVESGLKEGFGLEIIGDHPISVSTYQAWQGNGELARHMPVAAWGTEYRTMNFYLDRYGNQNGYLYRPSQIVLIAESDNTDVDIITKVKMEAGKSVPQDTNSQGGIFQYHAILNRGETLLMLSEVDESQLKDFISDPSGTRITSSKPIAVVSGHTKVAVMRYPDELPPTGFNKEPASFVRNNIHDVMHPIELAGTSFVTLPFMYTPTRVTGQASSEYGIEDDRGDVIRVIALEDSTTIKAMRSTGQGLLNMWKINRGETRLATAVEIATYWESDKPILMGQYGKSYAKILPPKVSKGENPQHPTIEAGMPTLTHVPPTSRYVNYGTFKSPEGMDNFFNIVFRPEQIGKIKVDGRALNSAFGGSMRMLLGTPFAYIRTPISPGDHVVESEEDAVKWMAWTYGSLDGLQQGRAYSTPVSLDLSIPCQDSVSVTQSIDCNGVKGATKIISKSASCGAVFEQYVIDTVNMTYVITSKPDSANWNWEFRVVDKSKSANAAIRVISRSGKFLERSYEFVADTALTQTASVDFGYQEINSMKCENIVITNPSETQVTITDIKAKKNPSWFTFSSKSFVLAPKGSKVVDVCAVVEQPTGGKVFDTVVVATKCGEYAGTQLALNIEAPTIFCDNSSWRVRPGDAWHTQNVTIQNRSHLNVVVYGYDSSAFTGSHFRVESGLDTLPLAIEPLGRRNVGIGYNPFSTMNQEHKIDVAFHSNAKVTDTVMSLTGYADYLLTIEEQDSKNTLPSPNPLSLSQHAFLSISTTRTFQRIVVYNAIGEIVFKLDSGESPLIPTSVFRPGMYTIRLVGPNQETLLPLICLE